MKLSEIKGERAVEVIADLIEPITNIATDKEELQALHTLRKGDETDMEVGIRVIKEKMPRLLKSHKDDVLSILSTINDKDPDEFSLVDIFNGISDLVKDKDFLNLFLSVNKTTEQTQLTERSAGAEHLEPES